MASGPPRWPGSNLRAAITRTIRIMPRYLKYPAIYAFTHIYTHNTYRLSHRGFTAGSYLITLGTAVRRHTNCAWSDILISSTWKRYEKIKIQSTRFPPSIIIIKFQDSATRCNVLNWSLVFTS